MFCSPACQLIGMSATLSNLEHLKVFMKADLFTHQFRPVNLTEYVKVDQLVYKVDTNCQDPREMLAFYRQVESGSAMDPDNLSELVTEVVPAGSCLIFCPTRKSAENVCLLLTKVLPSDLLKHKKQEKKIFLKRLIQECDGRICNVQRQCVPYGLAYHHSGLTADERRLIQDAFLEGILCALCCTSTLAAGVNLPAKRVILRTFTVGNRFMSKQEYKQMTGRAGRAGMDDNGESIAIAQQSQKSQVEQLLSSNFDACKSSLLYDDGRGLKNLLLSTIGLKMIKCKADIVQIVKLTLLYVQCKESEENKINSIVQQALKFLLNEKLVTTKEDEIVTSPLGAAVCKGGIDVDISRRVHSDLLTALQNMVLLSHFHLLYCIVPYSVQYPIFLDWNIFYDEFFTLTEVERSLLRSLGVNEQFVIMRRKGSISSSKTMDVTLVQRVFLAFILRRIWNKENVWEVAGRFRASRGAVQQLVHSALGFASSLCRFVEQLDELWALRSLLPDFVKAFQFNVAAELIPLMEIHGVQRARARQLYKAGYKSVVDVANADAASLVQALQHVHKGIAYQMIRSAKMLLHEKVEGLLESAEALLAADSTTEFTLEDIVATYLYVMRPLTDEEMEAVFKKLAKFIGTNIRLMVNRDDENYVFRLHKNRVYYLSEKKAVAAASFGFKEIVNLGSCIGKFTKSNKFFLTITALSYVAPYAKYKAWLRPKAEQSFLYGNHVLKSGLARITDDVPANAGVILYSSSDLPLGFGVSTKSTANCRAADPTSLIILNQCDIGQYVRDEEHVC
ncbi:helicase protein [Trichuris suis]|nr:helicase protein [Trichuris suis]